MTKSMEIYSEDFSFNWVQVDWNTILQTNSNDCNFRIFDVFNEYLKVEGIHII